jgi:hypothetical protein
LTKVWQDRFTALGHEDRFVAVEARWIDRMFFAKALELAAKFSLRSERAIALMYDVTEQSGLMKPSLEQSIAAKLADPALTSETDRMVAIANLVADATPAPFRDDVRARKMIIATGRGELRGVSYDLDALGITVNPPAPATQP